jgi:hypothetical protein
MNCIRSLGFFVLGLILVSASCKKERVPPSTTLSELDNLAPPTQTGANIIGCLVDGVILNSSNNGFTKHVYSSYRPLFNGHGYTYSLSVSGYRNTAFSVDATISIQTDSLAVHEGQTILLSKAVHRGASASYEVDDYGNGSHLAYNTTITNPGSLKITRLDSLNNILSGTFTFNGVDSQGDMVHITNGRFDVKYLPY